MARRLRYRPRTSEMRAGRTSFSPDRGDVARQGLARSRKQFGAPRQSGFVRVHGFSHWADQATGLPSFHPLHRRAMFVRLPRGPAHPAAAPSLFRYAEDILMADQKIRIRLKAFDHRLIDRSHERDRRDGQADQRAGARARSHLPTKIRALHHAGLAARRQGPRATSTRPARTSACSTSSTERQDRGRADEARARGWRRRPVRKLT